jgi:hypothetical protein
MTLVTIPHVGIPTTETQFSIWGKAHGYDGVMYKKNTPSPMEVYADNSGMQIKVRPGSVMVRGFIGYLDKILTVPVEASDPSDRTDLVVYRLYQTFINQKAQGEILVLKNTTTPVRTEIQEYDIPLARIKVKGGTFSILPGDVSDVRPFIGEWKSAAERPQVPGAGSVGYNTGIQEVEFFDGTNWKVLVRREQLADVAFTGEFGQLIGLPIGKVIQTTSQGAPVGIPEDWDFEAQGPYNFGSIRIDDSFPHRVIDPIYVTFAELKTNSVRDLAISLTTKLYIGHNGQCSVSAITKDSASQAFKVDWSYTAYGGAKDPRACYAVFCPQI